VTEILSTVRVGRLVRQERLEDEGRIQSWVLAGERGAVEARGARRDEIYYLVHMLARSGKFSGGHSLLVLVDAAVFPEDRCTILDRPCHVTLLTGECEHECGVLCGPEPWPILEYLYHRHLGDHA
jgi:hypothetical protein